MAWQGYLLKFGDVEVPLSYIQQDGFEQIPNQREEIKASRDDYTRELKRVTASGQITKTKIKFRRLNGTQMEALVTVMNNGLVLKSQRKYKVTYWNIENARYETGEYYIPDITYTVHMADEDRIIYEAFEMTLIGYATSEVA